MPALLRVTSPKCFRCFSFRFISFFAVVAVAAVNVLLSQNFYWPFRPSSNILQSSINQIVVVEGSENLASTCIKCVCVCANASVTKFV